MKRLLPIVVLALAVAAFAAACGGGGEATPAGEVPTVDLPATPPAEPAPPSSDPAPAETPAGHRDGPTARTGAVRAAAEPFTYEVWFTKGESLFVVHRTPSRRCLPSRRRR